jgi:hypothetical protein
MYICNDSVIWDIMSCSVISFDLSIYLSMYLSIFLLACLPACLWLYSLLLGLSPFFSFLIFYTAGRTPWAEDQPVARPLPEYRTTQTHNKRTYIHASSGIRTQDPNVWAGEDSSCLRPRGHWERLSPYYMAVYVRNLHNYGCEYLKSYSISAVKRHHNLNGLTGLIIGAEQVLHSDI